MNTYTHWQCSLSTSGSSVLMIDLTNSAFHSASKAVQFHFEGTEEVPPLYIMAFPRSHPYMKRHIWPSKVLSATSLGTTMYTVAVGHVRVKDSGQMALHSEIR
ncbi:hypothetical protein BT93_C1220 [Corymbia citriodora subsp. variegata]|nr:hypothetical protein BT93_C1220 [Corymbia citriodora subsp. variegata]